MGRAFLRGNFHRARLRMRPLPGIVALVVLLASSHQASAQTAKTQVLTVGCGNIIGSTRSVGVAQAQVAFGSFAGPPRRLQRPAQAADESWPYFAKSGVEVRAGSGPVTVSVSRNFQDQAAISWGNGLAVVETVRFRRCRAAPDRWNAYAGGLFTRPRSACVPLVIRIGSRSKTVHAGVGQSCGGPHQ
jgi:hypothetical protein